MTKRAALRSRIRSLLGSAMLLSFALAPPAIADDTAPTTEPQHLRLIWQQDPAHEATMAWSTQALGREHRVYFDTVPRHGDLNAYAFSSQASRNGFYVEGPFAYHHADMTGLEPATRYYLVVVSDDHVSDEYHFITAPADDRPFRLLSGGDSRSQREHRQFMNGVLRKLFERYPETLALAHGGDYVSDGASWADWQAWLEDHQETITGDGRLLPLIPARGNHERSARFFDQIFGRPGQGRHYYTSRIGRLAFFVLNTEVSLAGRQRHWLDNELAMHSLTSRWMLASYHRPAFPAVKSPSGARQQWVPLFEKYFLDAAFESDGHAVKRTLPIRNDQYDPSGVVYLGEGGLGVKQRDAGKRTAWYFEDPGYATSGHHVHVVTVHPDALLFQVLGADGQLYDTYTMRPRRDFSVLRHQGSTVVEPLQAGSVWAYYDRQAAPPEHWFATDFAGAADWAEGRAPFGARRDEARTVVLDEAALHLRKTITIDQEVSQAQLVLRYNAEISVWLDGHRIVTPAADADLGSMHDAQSGLRSRLIDIAAEHLSLGDHVLAVRVESPRPERWPYFEARLLTETQGNEDSDRVVALPDIPDDPRASERPHRYGISGVDIVGQIPSSVASCQAAGVVPSLLPCLMLMAFTARRRRR